MTTAASPLDIYGVLGVQPDAPAALAREMYWAKVAPLLQGGRQDGAADESIAALNHALAIILDGELRTAYDAERRRHERQTELLHPPLVEAPLGKSTPRATFVAAVLASTAVASVVFAFTGGLAAALLPASVGCAALLALFAGSRTRVKRARSAFEVLRILPVADAGQIDIAYRTRAQELLLLVRHHPRTLGELEALDQAYLEAMATALRASSVRPVEARSQVGGRWWAGRRWLRPAAMLGCGAIAVAQVVGHWSWLLVRGALVGAAGVCSAARAHLGRRNPHWRLHRRSALALRRRARLGVSHGRRATTHGRPGPDSPGVRGSALDLERRLSGGLLSNAMQVAAAALPVDPPADAREAAPLTPIWMLLESPAGTRRVPIEAHPIRIGSAAECYLVLPAREGVAPEHVLVWRHGATLLLHVTDSHAACTVNGKPVTWAALEHGDRVRIGNIDVAVEVGGQS